MNLLTLSQVARRLGVSEKTARQFKSELPGVVLIGRRVKYTEEAIAEFVRRGGCRPVGSQSQPAAV
jgi:predicted site-specific integrase-resolvase